MFTTDLYVDRVMPDAELARAFGRALGVRHDRVAVVSANDLGAIEDAWKHVDVLLRTSRVRGEFPLAVDLMVRDLRPSQILPMLERTAKSLHAAILTDEVGVNPYSDREWLLIGPDGTATQVFADAEEFGADDPAIILIGDSRRILHELQIEAPFAG